MVDYRKIIPALEALRNGKTLDEAKKKVQFVDPKGKEELGESEEETEEVGSVGIEGLFKEIAKNYENLKEAQKWIDELNKNRPKPLENKYLFKLFGIFKKGNFIYKEAISPIPDWNLGAMGYSMGYSLLRGKRIGRAKYAIFIDVLSQFLDEGQWAITPDSVFNTVIDKVETIYQDLALHENVDVTGALERFKIIDNDDVFIKVSGNAEDVASRYYSASLFLSLKYQGKDDEADEISTNWRKAPPVKFDQNYLQTFKNLRWGQNLVNERLTVENWNAIYVRNLPDYLNSLKKEDRDRFKDIFIALGMGGKAGSIYDWKLYSEKPKSLQPFFAVPIPKGITATQELASFSNYNAWLRIIEKVFLVTSLEDAKKLKGQMDIVREKLWSIDKYMDDRKDLAYSNDVLKTFLTKTINVSLFWGTKPGVLPIFYQVMKQPYVYFEKDQSSIIVALNVLFNLIVNQTISVKKGVSKTNKFNFSKLQIMSIFAFGRLIGYVRGDPNNLKIVREWVTKDTSDLTKLHVPDVKNQIIHATGMVHFTMLILEIMDERTFLDYPDKSVSEIVGQIYTNRVSEWDKDIQSRERLFEEYVPPSYLIIEEEEEEEETEEEIVSQAEPFLYEFSLECIKDFQSLVDTSPMSVTMFTAGNNTQWPRKTLVNALNKRKGKTRGCVAVLLMWIEENFANFNVEQRNSLIEIATIVGAYQNGKFVEGWAGIDAGAIPTTNNLHILAKNKTAFFLRPIREIAQAWAYFTKALELIGKNESILPIVESLDNIGFDMEKKLFDENGIFVGMENEPDFTRQQDLQRDRTISALIGESAATENVFSLFKKIRKSPDHFETFKQHVSLDDLSKYGLIKIHYGRYVYSTGIITNVNPDATSNFVPEFSLANGETVPYDQGSLNRLQRGYDALKSIMRQILNGEDVVTTLPKNDELPDEIK